MAGQEHRMLQIFRYQFLKRAHCVFAIVAPDHSGAPIVFCRVKSRSELRVNRTGNLGGQAGSRECFVSIKDFVGKSLRLQAAIRFEW